jgi:hypothetical protein
MGFADGGQILLADTEFHVLQPRQEYSHAFTAYLTTDKHGAPLRVYQYIAPGCLGLNTDVPSHFRSAQAADKIRTAARVAGLTGISVGRAQAAREIIELIPHAKRRVWLLAVTLTVDLSIRDLIPALRDHVNGGRDVRILLLDSLRSPAVFRALLEAKCSQAKRVVQYRRTTSTPPGGDPYFALRLYCDFQTAHSELSNEETLVPNVRFYAHSPTCWLVVIDDVAYVMPYTLGHLKHSPQRVSPLTTYSPVFKFEADDSRHAMVEVLASHFNRLWVTSDVDLFHESIRIAERDRILRKMFDERGAWFRTVCEAVHTRKTRRICEEDRRVFPRMPCKWHGLRVVLEDGTKETLVGFVNYSRVGICAKRFAGPTLRAGQVVDARLLTKIPSDAYALRLIEDELGGKRYRVVWVDKAGSNAGLQMVNSGEGYNKRRKTLQRILEEPAGRRP